ncbi:EF-hand domain-containing protein D2 isoform X1 [Octopus bimaculoides]|uniref:EF-hand domain-containing protein n=1 Tax=Octopus bimaculoides TaxID=37653 RepID=A0A0L8GRG9_OCTBM|nr:EF-hand domain-containing protein D2 isoform X1 [Octopus bimaculoides]|eukprot:XP_014778637.1 PREDICTED: EF-hand domain-containing protein D2-like isoform X2 [Octopus bimaculoides]
MATEELSNLLTRRNDINDAIDAGETVDTTSKIFNPYTEFKEFTRQEIKEREKLFNKYDVNKDKFIDIEELKVMMEKLGAPQTHLALKEMIKEVDEDEDNKINFREFLLIFRKAAAEELNTDSGLYELYQNVWEIDVDKEGVKGAKNFFEAKIDAQTWSKKFENEIKEEQEERKKQAEEAKERKKAFKEKASVFQ